MLFKKHKTVCSPEIQQIIYESFFDRVYRCALSLTRDPAAAEEVAQETFMIAFEKYHQLRDPAKIGAWLVAIALNVARANYNQSKKVVPLNPDDIARVRDNYCWQNMEKLLEDREIVQDLKEAISELPMEFKEVLILKYYTEMEVEEIAFLLEIPLGTVKSRLSRARERLRKMLISREFGRLSSKGGN
ncbi:RNA polymerase sigma factor, region 2 [Moorella glycerini]|uniref:RNA polymerase sigma factor n=1 Tax=Neomoorella stamsii TaxID=1266720 RepID=A0A9X7IZY3_9FIRM|nr:MULTISPECIES: sigma-70 family RNA polymerase sigma factor [Moorella]PRR68836.1 ECF RNA polymerase sigma factor SigR [Moorella stamsii]CEP67457.1 RNA polymerase sigma factor, region 2 [Moorella glycerini]